MILEILLVSLLSFLGLIFGVILAIFTKEELKPGSKYFNMLIKIILITILLFLSLKLLYNSLFPTLVAFSIGIISSILFRKNYLYFGILIFTVSFYEKEFFSFILALIFLYGLPFGTIIATNNINKIKKVYPILISNFILFIIPSIILVLESISSQYKSLLLAFSAGAILVSLLK